MQLYPQYRLEDFYGKHSWEGGLTITQIKALYGYAMERKNDEYKFYALLHGYDLDKDSEKSSSSPPSSEQKRKEQQKKQSLPIFGDPEEYKDMSEEERNELTQKMMNQHQAWAKSSTGKKIGR